MCTWFYEGELFKVNVGALPTESDVDKMIHCIQDSENSIIIFSKESNVNISLPSLSLVFYVLKKLTENTDLIRTRLKGTCILTNELCESRKTLIGFALTLYRPKKPVFITDDEKKATRFVKRLQQNKSVSEFVF